MYPVKFTITGNPVVKKNSRPIWKNRRTGKGMLGKSDALVAAEEEAYYQLKEQMRGDYPVLGKLHVKFLFYRKDQRHTDLSNLIEFPADCLQRAGIIENDVQIESLDGSRKLLDTENPRTEIYIFPFEQC